MQIRNTILLSFLFFFATFHANGQGKNRDIFHDSNGDTFHQLFLDFKATEILEIKYSTDSLPVDGKLSVDGFSIIIKNYPGDKSVKVKLKDEKGEQKEITKSRCYIDPVILQL